MVSFSSSTTGSASVNGAASGTADVNTSANNSVSLGTGCAPNNTGLSNAFVGYAAAADSLKGDANVVVGYGAAAGLGGNGNVITGATAGPAVTFASGNVLVGMSAGAGVVTGASNVMLGAASGTVPGVAGLGAVESAVAVGAVASAASGAVSVGAAASAIGSASVALGSNVVVRGDGHFSLASRVEGYFTAAGGVGGGRTQQAYDTYAVQVNADVLKVANGGALAFCARVAPVSSSFPSSNVSSLASAGTSAAPTWTLQLAAPASTRTSSVAPDLVFSSANGASVRFVDDFVPGVLDFTAQHRCVFECGGATPALHPPHPSSPLGRPASDRMPGLLVVATGRYRGGRISADEAVPHVALCTRAYDPRVFGVLSATPAHPFRLGNLAFDVPYAAFGFGFGSSSTVVVVNSAGEGGMWVSDENGPISNGDLLTSSGRLPGHAMNQGSDAVCSYTVAKATCDCAFDPVEDDATTVFTPGSCPEGDAPPAPPALLPLRVALIGVTYRF
jgi:hypothetical protein